MGKITEYNNLESSFSINSLLPLANTKTHLSILVIETQQWPKR